MEAGQGPSPRTKGPESAYESVKMPTKGSNLLIQDDTNSYICNNSKEYTSQPKANHQLLLSKPSTQSQKTIQVKKDTTTLVTNNNLYEQIEEGYNPALASVSPNNCNGPSPSKDLLRLQYNSLVSQKPKTARRMDHSNSQTRRSNKSLEK